MSDINYAAVHGQVELSCSVRYRTSICFLWIFKIYLFEQNLSLQLDLGYYDKRHNIKI